MNDSAVFRFKRFSVRNGLAAQKVGTDGVLLGAVATLPVPCPLIDAQHLRLLNVLDIGTGTGVVALILAQRLSDAGLPADIKGIDIDAAAAHSAAASFAGSPWAENLTALHTSLEDFADSLYRAGAADSGWAKDAALMADAGRMTAAGLKNDAAVRRFDLIVSNPPYYDTSLPCMDDRRNLARHTDSLSWREIVTFAADFLVDGGRLAMILPKQEEKSLLRFASSFGLFPMRLLSVSTSPEKSPRRLVAEFTAGPPSAFTPGRESMVVGDEGYLEVTRGFYL